jgi:hypothetical protein
LGIPYSFRIFFFLGSKNLNEDTEENTKVAPHPPLKFPLGQPKGRVPRLSAFLNLHIMEGVDLTKTILNKGKQMANVAAAAANGNGGKKRRKGTDLKPILTNEGTPTESYVF